MVDIQDVTITQAELDAVAAGETVVKTTDGGVTVAFVKDDAGGPRGAERIPVGEFMRRELVEGGRSGWTPSDSPYAFGIKLSE